MSLRAYECTVRGTCWHRVVHATTSGRAKAEYWRDVHEAWQDIPYTAITARCVGGPITDDRFRSVAEYRGVPFARIGMAVEVGGARGVIVGHNSSSNFNVHFEAGKYSGQILNCHPNWSIRYFGRDGQVLAEFGGAR